MKEIQDNKDKIKNEIDLKKKEKNDFLKKRKN